MHRRKKDHGRAEALLIVAWALGLRALKPRPEEPGDIIITESNGFVPSSTVIAGGTLGDNMNDGEEPAVSPEISLESEVADSAAPENGIQQKKQS